MQLQNAHLAVASVPVQSWGELYDQDAALKTGTVFKDLDLPFFAADQIPGTLSSLEDSLKSPEEIRWRDKMLEVQKVSFMMDDLRLYLDTHPEDQDALAVFRDVVRQRKQTLSEFAEQLYPRTTECMAETYENAPSSACYCWQKGAAPWEGVCC